MKMNESNVLTPKQIAEKTSDNAVTKAGLSLMTMLLLGIAAGAYIAVAGFASNMAAFNLLSSPDTYGLGRFVAGILFTGGLIMVVLSGGELFTGNNLMIMGVLDRRISAGAMLRNWVIVYCANFLGGLLIALLGSWSGLFTSGGNLLGVMTIKIAAGKIGLSFGKAVVLGFLCNWLVCLAVWQATGSKDMAGKILGIFFPILLFVTAGFEHSIANMYYISAGILASHSQALAGAAVSSGLVTSDALQNLTWGGMLLHNLLPVTLGNILGGSGFVGMLYWFVYRRHKD